MSVAQARLEDFTTVMVGTRPAPEHAPFHKVEWAPQEKPMRLGRLAGMYEPSADEKYDAQ